MESEEKADCELTFFVERQEALSLITSFTSINWDVSCENDVKELHKILEKYLEQPQLLAPHVMDMLSPINSYCLDVANACSDLGQGLSNVWQTNYKTQFDVVCKLFYLICKVRGYKHVIKYLPHEVHHFESCLLLLTLQKFDDFRNWQTSYFLLLWLSVLCLIPFDICSMDSSISTKLVSLRESTCDSKLVQTIVQHCKEYLASTGPTREASAICVSCLMTRPDMSDSHLSQFMAWAIGVVTTRFRPASNSDVVGQNIFAFKTIGVLHSLALIYKTGHRGKLLPFADDVLSLCQLISDNCGDTMIRKLTTKLLQRIGMNFLPPKVASWRYDRGKRSLMNNLIGKLDSPAESQWVCNDACVADETSAELSFDMSEALETIIDKLSLALCDKETLVRWSAAKGIGRITMRLERQDGDDVVRSVLEIFTENVADNAWHGGCLAVAELARRGLLLPERLQQIVPYIVEALQFDVLRGQHSVGAHVRDAACYVCWAFARAYSPDIMCPYIEQLSSSMLITALYDREVNCRRAASAAFQENVGRQGNEQIGYGMDAIRVANYFSLGNRSHSYLQISPEIAMFDLDIKNALVHHLASTKLNHWDVEIRTLASQAIARLVASDFDGVDTVLRGLTQMAVSNKLSERHGNCLGVAETVHAVRLRGRELAGDIVDDVLDVVGNLDRKRLYRGRGGELTRIAACRLVENILCSGLRLSLKLCCYYLESLDQNLRQAHEIVQNAACTTLRRLFWYMVNELNHSDKTKLEQLLLDAVVKYIDDLDREENVAITRGVALALGTLPAEILTGSKQLKPIISCLSRAVTGDRLISGELDADTRRNALISVVEVFEKSIMSSDFDMTDLHQCFDILHLGSNDYFLDKRGDTGSWTRICSIKGMQRILYAVLRKEMFSVSVDMLALSSYSASTPSVLRVSDGDVTFISCYATGTNSYAILNCRQLTPLGTTDGLSSRTAGSNVVCTSNLSCTGSDQPDAQYMMSSELLNSIAFYVRPEEKLIPHVKRYPVLATPNIVSGIMSAVLKQLAEKLDNVREAAGRILAGILLYRHDASSISGDLSGVIDFPDRSMVIHAIETKLPAVLESATSSMVDLLQMINWAKPEHVFPFLVELLSSDTHNLAVFSGLIVSVGALTENVARCSSAAFVEFCTVNKHEGCFGVLSRIILNCITTFDVSSKDDRVIVPLLKTVNLILRNGLCDVAASNAQIPSEEQYHQLLNKVSFEMKGCTAVVKIQLCLDVFLLLLSCGHGSVQRLSLKALINVLTHKYPKVRKYVAELLYLHFISSDDKGGLVATILAEKSWDTATRSALTEARKQIAEMLGIELDAPAEKKGLYGKSSSTDANCQKQVDILDSYDSLVRDAGY